ncbi:hypothetical protein CEXT_419061 [Caerostris extrusa]|uniref:Uncharacterized protein n=1 Tax=Caerostris extrusa TaxID=172846 RepID=A0AAV4RVR2_CAEEX|nr:hypothetical protein CEXT_419061 [Caerostris extrusa]
MSVYLFYLPYQKKATATNRLHFWVALFTMALFRRQTRFPLFTRLIEELRRLNNFVEREQRFEFESVQIYADLEPLLATLSYSTDRWCKFFEFSLCGIMCLLEEPFFFYLMLVSSNSYLYRVICYCVFEQEFKIV